MRNILISLCSLLYAAAMEGQESPNFANAATQPSSAAMAGKMSDANINLFVGTPSVSIPIYSYKGNSGTVMSISLDYNGGGVKVTEAPTMVGLSWFLSAGGTITRTVKGMPDDMPTNGYIYAGDIPADWRSNGSKYYHDSIDAQQDVFQFSYPGGSGRFFLGKNGQILVSPNSKLKVIPGFRTPDIYFPTTLKSFRLVAENGVKYDFEEADYTHYSVDYSFFGQGYSPDRSGYEGTTYPVLWYLTRIISPFSSDTIKINYQSIGEAYYSFKFPQITFVNNANGTRVTPTFAPGYGGAGSRKISSVEFPDSTTVSFIYSYAYKYGTDYALSKIKVKDTAFRFGYLLEYDTTTTYYEAGHSGNPSYRPIKLLLKSVTPYTSQEKQTGYSFSYTEPLFPRAGEPGDTFLNRQDYWGYYNAINNPPDTLLPKINGYNWGADRRSTGYAIANSLNKIFLPTGGYVKYNYVVNDHYPYTKESNSLSIAPASNTQNTITLNQVFNTKHQLQFFLDKSVSRNGTAPVSGSGNLNLYIKSTDGTITYLTSAISLYDLFYSGLRTWTFNLNNGTYRLETSLSGGTGITGSFPININWENKNADNSASFKISGGIKISSTEVQATGAAADVVYSFYTYLTEDGKNSGFLGDIPKYDYPYRKVDNSTSTITDYTAVSSEPVSVTDYAQGSPVGYSRVEVLKITDLGQNIGKEVYEFTDLRDVNGNPFTAVFPYIPNDIRSWGLGLPKRISLYDSSGLLVKRTVNTYEMDTVFTSSNNFKSLKLGHSQTNYSSNPSGKQKIFIGQEYYPVSGRINLVYTADTLYQNNGTLNTSWQQIVYDTNYNVTKIITSYDRTRNLKKEQRMYYPYNYTVGDGIGKMRDSSVISQMVATETWITDDANHANDRILSAAVTSFRQIANGDVKPDTIYSFESNKPVIQATIGSFNPGQLNRNTTYFKPQSYFTSYNTKGNLIEMKNLVTGQSSAIIIDHNQQYPVARVSNAQQADIAYTSFETVNNGNWTVSSGQRDISDKLTGKKSYNLSNGNITKSGLSSGKQYLLTVWAKTGASVSVNGSGVGTAFATQNNWSLYSVALTGITSVTVSGSGLIDELRLHPKTANMVTTAYEPMIGPISTTDANNTVAYSEYDNLNRLKLVRDKYKNIVQKFEFSDSSMLISATAVWQGFDKGCSINSSPPGGIDSLYRDINPFSDSSGYVKRVYQGYLDCNCPEIANNPQYKVVNGVCEMGSWGVVSTVYKKVLVNGEWTWTWECTYRYCFSDGSQSVYSNIGYSSVPCSLTCLGIDY